MMECDRLRAEAAGLAALPADDPERAAAEAHARVCAGCARALREGEGLQGLLGHAEPAKLPPGALSRASLAVLADLRREARRRAGGSVLAAAAAFLVFLALARHPSRAGEDWALASFLGVSALALAALASRRSLLAMALALAAALGAALAAGRTGLVESGLGLHCLATELASASAVIGAVWLAIRGGATSPARSALAAAAAAGALAGDAALQITCAARAEIPHLLAFHVGGVVVAAAAASLVRRGARRTA
jgi:hypothetical protein